MAKPPCDSDDYFYGYRPQDVIRIGEPGKQGKPGPSGKGVKGDKGDRGPPGSDGGIVVVTAGSVIHGRRVIRIENGFAHAPDLLNNSHASQVLGISIQAAMEGNPFSVCVSGPMNYSSWSWNPGYIYCNSDGVLTQDPPATGWLQRVARVISPNNIIVDIDTPFIRTP